MQFVLPRSLLRPPESTDAKTSVRAVPARTLAVSTFSGTVSAPRLVELESLLRSALARDGLAVAPGALPLLARYNPPWTPSPLRTNEILLPVVE